MVAGPEMARVVTEFLDGIDKPGLVSDTRHHEDNPAAQATFLRHVESFGSSISEMGNPFMDPSGDLLVLDNRVVAECTIVESVQTIDNIGPDRLITRTKHLNDTITRAKLPLFHSCFTDICTEINQGSEIRGKHSKLTEPCFPPCTLPVKFDTLIWLIFSDMTINRIRLPCLTIER